MNTTPIRHYQYLETNFGDTPTLTFMMKVQDIVEITYVAVRGVDKEDGAVQRYLNKTRIKDIQKYILDGNTFFNSFILNWTNTDFQLIVANNVLTLPIVNGSAQVIDGQHRLAGFEEAMRIDPKVGERNVIVTMCRNLSTKKAAEIFLNINTEQKPVPKSLMYDLFGEVIDDETHSINRAADIARLLNDDPDSPLYKQIKFPGTPRGIGSIELSTFIGSLKEHFKPNGVFYTHKLSTLDYQKNVINNFFQSIKNFYNEKGLWFAKTKNPFLKAAGFSGAIDFLTSALIKRCAEKGSFTVDTITTIIAFDNNDYLTLDEIKNLDGKTSRKKVKDALEASLLKLLPNQKEYEF